MEAPMTSAPIDWHSSFRGTPRPVASDYTVEQRWPEYRPEEHAVWRTLFERQRDLLPARACPAFLKGFEHLPFGPEEIPDFGRLSERLQRATGWQVVPVPGL